VRTALAFLTLLLLAGSPYAAQLAPHRAIYDLSLLRANEGASLQSAAGKLAFELDGSSCEGYTVNFRMATRYRPKEGSPTLFDTVAITFESADATELRHQVREKVNGELREDKKIRMTRPSASAAGEARLPDKSAEPIVVPAGAMLPMQHQLRLMALGAAGGGRDSSVIFDGSDGGKSFQAVSFVGKEKPSGSIARDTGNPAAAPLKGNHAWPMTVSYFELDGSAETPDYQVSFDLYDNGVATGLVLDYGEFALRGTLTDLKLLGQPSCP
jgi:hypothetical protein